MDKKTAVKNHATLKRIYEPLARINAATDYLNCRISVILLRTGGTLVTDIAKELGYGKEIIGRHVNELYERGLVETSYRKADRFETIDSMYAKPTKELYRMDWMFADMWTAEV